MDQNSDFLKHKHHEGHNKIDGITSNLTEHFYLIPSSVEVKHVERLEKEVFGRYGSSHMPEEVSLVSCNFKPHIFLDEKNYSFTLEDDIVTRDDDFFELEIKKTIGATEAFEHNRDLWIPSHRTKHALSMKNSYTYCSDRDLLTNPEIHEEELTDGLEQLVGTLDERERTNINIPYDVSEDENGLLELVEKEAFRSAVNLTGRLLVQQGLSLEKTNGPRIHSPQFIQLWYTRLALLVKMKEFRTAEVEASKWEDFDKPDLYYQFYPEIYGGRNGSMIPFQMRLLVANIPSFSGQHSESLVKLFSILAIVKKIQQNVENEIANQAELNLTDYVTAKNVWVAREKRVLISIVNVAVKLKDFILAVEIINRMIKNESTFAKKQVLYSVLGRIYLQFGDLTNAEKYFFLAQPNVSGDGSLGNDLRDFQNVVDQGLLAFARNDFHKGYKYFEKASFIDPSSLFIMNNCSVCLFYMGHLREAIRLLTGAINNDPLHALQDSLMLNLSTMYELSTAQSKDKKLELLKLSRLFRGDSTDIFSFRLL